MDTEDESSNVGNVMSSIGLAISQFFTGKAEDEEEVKNQEQEQGDDNTHVYANLNDHDEEIEEGNVKSRPEDRIPMPVSNKYTFAEKVESAAAQHAKKFSVQQQSYNKMESSSDSEEDNMDDTNAISYSASFKGDG